MAPLYNQIFASAPEKGNFLQKLEKQKPFYLLGILKWYVIPEV